MAMIKVSIKLSNCESEGFSSNSNVHIDYSKSKVKFRGSECDQDFREPVRLPRTNDEDHAPEVVSAPPRKKNPPSVQNKVKQCGGNACPHCHKCMDWSYKGDLHDDYKRLQRDNKYRNILDKQRWCRHPDATCKYHAGSSHCYACYDTYHSFHAYYPTLCECE